MQSRRRSLRLVAGALALCLLPLASSAQDHDARSNHADHSPTVEDLTRASDLVVVARVVENQSRWVGKKIVTTARVEPLEALKGEVSGPLEVAFLGGTVGVIRQTATHMPTLTEGEVAILFLDSPPAKAAAVVPGYRILGEEGKVHLLHPGESQDRLSENRRLRRFVDEVARRVRKGGK